MNTCRVVGLETEYGVALDPCARTDVGGRVSAESLSVAAAKAVREWQSDFRPNGEPVAWDWSGENPLQDLRGTHLDRASAHPSLLTDSPDVFAPSGDEPGYLRDCYESAGVSIKREDLGNLSSPMLTNVVLSNGGRFYVDHAHPEYATPEVCGSREAVIWDVAGEIIAREAMAHSQENGVEVILYKNNTDSKGSAYGSHENYQIPRSLPFATLRDYLVPFLATRPVICGSGRVGIGQHSEKPGFQISQRADFIADLVGLQTTFNRPIVNTRDEPHAGNSWRRLHVINGDANRFQGSVLAKVAATRAWLAALEVANALGQTFPLQGLFFTGDPVEAVWRISHDSSLQARLQCVDGKERTSLQWQAEAAKRCGEFLVSADRSVLPSQCVDDAQIWLETTEMLAAGQGASRIEWVAKYDVFSRLAARLPGGWENPKLAALDIKWADLRPGCSPVDKIQSQIEQVVTQREIAEAALNPPVGTRAQERGEAVRNRSQLVAASWDTLVFETEAGNLRRVPLGDPIRGDDCAKTAVNHKTRS